jgi:hypothetical protein
MRYVGLTLFGLLRLCLLAISLPLLLVAGFAELLYKLGTLEDSPDFNKGSKVCYVIIRWSMLGPVADWYRKRNSVTNSIRRKYFGKRS